MSIFQDVAEKRNTILGGNHRGTLNARYWLARCYSSQKDYPQTILILEDVISKLSLDSGENHDLIVRSKKLLMNCHEMLNK